MSRACMRSRTAKLLPLKLVSFAGSCLPMVHLIVMKARQIMDCLPCTHAWEPMSLQV